MGRRKWKAGRSDEAAGIAFVRRFRKPIAIAAILVLAIAFFIYRFNTSQFQYGDTQTDYNRALADCMKDRTRVDNAGGAVDEAADSCVRDTPGPAGTEGR